MRRFEMIAWKHILVATDFGEAANAALTYGRALARRFGATLHVLHITDNVFVGPLVPDPIALERQAVANVNDLLTAEDRQTLSARAVAWTSTRPAAAIVVYARKNDIDLIVIGTHGRSGMAHVVMGSVAEKVVRMAKCPVLTMKHPEREFIASGDSAAATA